MPTSQPAAADRMFMKIGADLKASGCEVHLITVESETGVVSRTLTVVWETHNHAPIGTLPKGNRLDWSEW